MGVNREINTKEKKTAGNFQSFLLIKGKNTEENDRVIFMLFSSKLRDK